MVGILLYLNYNFLIFKKKHAVRRAGVLLRIAHQYLTVIIERKNKIVVCNTSDIENY